MKIIGDFDIERARDYESLIEKCNSGEINLQEKQGGRFNVILNGEHALKHVYFGDLNTNILDHKRENLIHEFNIGKGLEKIGIKVPRMHCVALGNIPFLVMERLNITHFSKLNEIKQEEFENQYKEQIDKAISNGYLPGDTNSHTNCGWDAKKGQVFFYDFGDWRIN